jgi:hypothetical protein
MNNFNTLREDILAVGRLYGENDKYVIKDFLTIIFTFA